LFDLGLEKKFKKKLQKTLDIAVRVCYNFSPSYEHFKKMIFILKIHFKISSFILKNDFSFQTSFSKMIFRFEFHF